MPNWTEPMQQTFEYYTVDPGTWKDIKLLDNVKKCTISRDLEAETLGSASIDITNTVGECYVRAYLITIQNGVKEKHPLGTFLLQTPSSRFDGKIREVSVDAYTPLLELKENPPPIGYSVFKGTNIMENVCRLTDEHMRGPVVDTECDEVLQYDFVANTSDTWLSFLIALAANAKYSYSLDELGRVLFSPRQDTASLRPVWTYDDGNSSILLPEMTMNHDLYGIPNVVEVVYRNYYVRVVNDDPNSPISTVSRGRKITHRDTNPSITGIATEGEIREYAERLLRDLSTVEYTITYSHGYCPVRIGDCVRLDYNRAGLRDIKAKVISQNINCEPGCTVSETAVFTKNLWG